MRPAERLHPPQCTKRGTIRRDRRPRLSGPVGRNTTALLRYRPVGRGLASRREAIPIAMRKKRHNPYGFPSRPAERQRQPQGIKRGTNRRGRRPRLSEKKQEHNITALLRYRPVGRGLASRRNATPTTTHQTRHNPYGCPSRPAVKRLPPQRINRGTKKKEGRRISTFFAP